MSTKASLLLTAASVALCLSADAAPVLTLVNDGSSFLAISGNGSTIIGSKSNAPFVLPVGGQRTAFAASRLAGISNDGLALTGYNSVSGEVKAYRWTQSQGFQYIQGLAPTSIPPLTLPRSANGLGISGDGTTIVGAYSTASTTLAAFKWVNGVSTSLGELPGGTDSSTAVSASNDGSVIAGQSQSSNGLEAFVKIGSASIKALGNVPSSPALISDYYTSAASAVSSDGSTIVGYGNLYTNFPQDKGVNVPRLAAATWKITAGTAGAATKLPAITLSDTTLTPIESFATATTSDGSVIVGSAKVTKATKNDTGTTSYSTSSAAVVWSGTTIHARLIDLLTTAGLTGLNEADFRSVVGISSNADTLIGNGDNGAWILTGTRPLFGLPGLDVILPKVSVQAGSSNPVITYNTVPGQSYQTQRSTDLVTWTNLGTAFSTAGQSGAGSNSVTDTTAPVGPNAFYRVTVQAAQ